MTQVLGEMATPVGTATFFTGSRIPRACSQYGRNEVEMALVNQ